MRCQVLRHLECTPAPAPSQKPLTSLLCTAPPLPWRKLTSRCSFCAWTAQQSAHHKHGAGKRLHAVLHEAPVQAGADGGLAELAALHSALPRRQEQLAALAATADGVGLVATRNVRAGEVLVEVPAEGAATVEDARMTEAAAALAEGRGELTALALWLLAERAAGSPKWAPLLTTLSAPVETPILWPAEQRAELLRGSPVLREAELRAAAVDAEWAQLAPQLAADPQRYPPDVYSREGFGAALAAVVARSAYLLAVSCFAVVPVLSHARRMGDESGAVLDYDPTREAVTLTASRPYRQGEEVAVCDGRPNGEMLLATGTIEDDNPADCLTVQVGLVQGDRMFLAKRQIVESLGLGTVQEFPVFRDRMPQQLLAYLRLARLQDAGLLACVSFEADVVLSPANEYEVLQLLLGECRDRLAAYAGPAEEDLKLLQRGRLAAREQLAARLRLAEKCILQSTMDAVRRRLAPIRGIPTKGGGMSDPNADLRDIFAMIESLPKLPGTVVGGLMSWARGEQDPEWKPRSKGGKGR